MRRLTVSAASTVWTVEKTRRGVHRLLVAHLADEDHVRVLAQDAAQALLEGADVHPDLALVDRGVLVWVQELDGVLERDDVPRPGGVDVVDHRREGRRLARARGAGEQDDAALLLGELADDGRQVEVVDRADVHRDRADDQRDAAALGEGVDAEAREAGDRVGEVDLVLDVELLELRRILEHVVHAVDRLLVGQRRGALERDEVAVEAHERPGGDLEVQVRAPGLDEGVQGSIEIEHSTPEIGRWSLVLEP